MRESMCSIVCMLKGVDSDGGVGVWSWLVMFVEGRQLAGYRMGGALRNCRHGFYLPSYSLRHVSRDEEIPRYLLMERRY